MPKPCGKPLTPNPFETYRDPLTGQWKVTYPSNPKSTAVLSVSTKSVSINSEGSAPKRATHCKRWEKLSVKQEVA